VSKINEYTVKSISMWNAFLKSFEHQGKLPEKLDEEAIDPFLHAHFYLARLHQRLLARAPAMQLANLARGLERYEYVARYVADRDLPNMHDEVDICKQMTELIPLKMERLRALVEAGRDTNKIIDEAPPRE
jgi:hypothetical protein